MKDNGYETYVAAKNNLKENEAINYCDKFVEIPIERSPLKINNIKAIKELKQLIEKEKIDLIHCHTPMGAVVARLAARKARKKYGTRVIYTAHGFHFFKGAPVKNWIMFYPVEWYLSKFTDTIITINHEDYELASKKFSKRCKDIQYVPGVGIDIKKFDIKMLDKDKEKYKKRLGLKKDDYVLTCVARLDKNKNQGFLINVMEELIKEHNNIHLLLAGRDELNGYYQNIVNEKHLNDNVHFLGNRDDVPELLAISNIVLSASKREGLPVNVLEAFASGKPVVALKCRGMSDLIKNGENGYVVDNEIDFTNSINELCNDRTNNFSKTNKLKSKNYNIEEIVSKFKSIYFSKKKILHLLATNSFSGAENVVCTIIKNMENDYDMAYCSPNGSIKDKMVEENINYIPINKLSYWGLRNVIKSYNPDIIHAHDNKATIYSSFFYKKCKIISHIHGNNIIMKTKNLKTILFNFCSKKISKFIWVSDSSLDNYYYKNNVKHKSIILYNVIDDKRIIEKSNEYKIKKYYDLIFLGRLSYPKNPERLIEIIKLIKTQDKNISLAIVGDGIERRKIENLVKNYDLEGNIKFYGFKKNPYPILRNSKILVMTSIYEGTPMCALEAQALGKPIIATPVDGLKKLITNDYNGYLTDDNKIFAEKVIEFLGKDYSDNVINQFRKNNNMSKYIDVIKEQY